MRGDTILGEMAVRFTAEESIPVRLGFRGEMDGRGRPSGGWFMEIEIEGETFRGEGPTVKEASEAMKAGVMATSRAERAEE